MGFEDERYTNSLPQRKQSYQIFSTRERKGFKLVAKRTEARPFLTHREGGRGRGCEGRDRPRKRGRKGKEEEEGTTHPTFRISADPPFREKHIPLFLNTEHEAKQSAWIAARVPPCHAFEQQDAGGMESRCSGVSAPTLHSPPWKDVKDYLCYLPGKRQDILLKDEWKMSTKS